MENATFFFFLATFLEKEERTTQAFHVHPKKESTCFSLNISFTIFQIIVAEVVLPDFRLNINQVLGRNQAIDNYFTLGFRATEILSCLLNVHGIHISLNQLRRVLKRRGCQRRGESTDDIVGNDSLHCANTI